MPSNLSQKELCDIIQWDVRNWKYALTFWEKHGGITKGLNVLALGERQGGISLFFAKRGCQVTCSDYNEFPASTKQLHVDYGVAENIKYAKVDMKLINLPDNSMDIVVFKSVLGALGNKPDQMKALNEIYRILKPGGRLLSAENLEGSFLHKTLRKKFVKWGSRWAYLDLNEFLTWNQKYNTTTFKVRGVLGLFGRNERQRKILSYVDSVIQKITPKKWRYILFGVFTK